MPELNFPYSSLFGSIKTFCNHTSHDKKSHFKHKNTSYIKNFPHIRQPTDFFFVILHEFAISRTSAQQTKLRHTA